MSLVVVSVPIGNFKDITLRALDTLRECEVLICEERKPAEVLFKKLEIKWPEEVFFLNEHSKPEEVKNLLPLCKSKKVALISDCGTPGFCDPGADLIGLCHKSGIPVDVNPGASSLMALLTLSGVKLDRFYFAGFLPAETEQRERKILELKKICGSEEVPFVIMDTPYRLNKVLGHLSEHFGDREAVLGLELTTGSQEVSMARLSDLAKRVWPKAPFVLLVGA